MLDEVRARSHESGWLREWAPMHSRLLLILEKDDVCAVRSAFFLNTGKDTQLSFPDDVVILPATARTWAAFYCHEDEYEFGQYGGAAQPGVEPDGPSARRLTPVSSDGLREQRNELRTRRKGAGIWEQRFPELDDEWGLLVDRWRWRAAGYRRRGGPHRCPGHRRKTSRAMPIDHGPQSQAGLFRRSGSR